MNDSTAKLHKDSAPEIVPAKQEGSARKEQSVLQTKLTKLAIQIGYAGNNFSLIMSLICFCCQCILVLSFYSLCTM